MFKAFFICIGAQQRVLANEGDAFSGFAIQLLFESNALGLWSIVLFFHLRGKSADDEFVGDGLVRQF